MEYPAEWSDPEEGRLEEGAQAKAGPSTPPNAPRGWKAVPEVAPDHEARVEARAERISQLRSELAVLETQLRKVQEKKKQQEIGALRSELAVLETQFRKVLAKKEQQELRAKHDRGNVPIEEHARPTKNPRIKLEPVPKWGPKAQSAPSRPGSSASSSAPSGAGSSTSSHKAPSS